MQNKFVNMQNELLNIVNNLDVSVVTNDDDACEQSNDVADAFISIVKLYAANNYDVCTLTNDALY